MKVKKKQKAPKADARPSRLPFLWAALAAVAVVFWAYSPALYGDFLFDDNVLPFALPSISAPLSVWLHGVRPILYFTYWVNAQMSGEGVTYSYHFLNVIFHCIASGLVFFIARRFIEWGRLQPANPNLLAGFAAAVFLLHPVQTEAVAYLAGRSESLSTMLVLAAFAVFLYRRQTAVTWSVAAGVFLLFGLAVLSKEQTIALPALLLLTDFWWNPGFSFKGIVRNWKLYIPIAAAGCFAVSFYWAQIMHAGSAGFAMKDFTWYQYFYTQWRALFVYIGEFLLPVRLTADWDFPISVTVLDHGAIFGLIALVALGAVAWYYRRRFPLAGYGYFAYLILMAPTSSILPIRDPIAERRLYFSMLGLLLILVDFLSRVKLQRKIIVAASVVLALLALTTHARAYVWSGEIPLWEDTTARSPNKARAHFQLASAYFDARHCDQAVAEYEKTSRLQRVDYGLLVDWALAYDCLNRTEDALGKMRQAVAMEPTGHAYSQLGMILAKASRWSEALEALATAERVEPGYLMTYVYRGDIYLKVNQPARAIPEYNRALSIDATSQQAFQGLLAAQKALRGGR